MSDNEKAKQRAKALQEVADKLVKIIDRHLPADGVDREQQYTDARKLLGYRWQAFLKSGWGKPSDKRALANLRKKMEKAVEAIELLSPDMARQLDGSFEMVEFGEDRKSLSDLSVPLASQLLLNMLLCSIRHVERTEALGSFQVKANLEAIALEQACGLLWQERTGRKRPMVSAAVGKDAPEPAPYHEFCIDVFNALGIRVNIASAQRAARTLFGEAWAECSAGADL